MSRLRTDYRARNELDVVELSTVASEGEHITVALVVVCAIAAVASMMISAGAVTGLPSSVSKPECGGVSVSMFAVSQPNERLVLRVLAEACAQYDVCQSAYLEGVVSALHEMHYGRPFLGPSAATAPAIHADKRTIHDRIRDYQTGRAAAVAWMCDDRADPPVRSILTEPIAGMDDGYAT